MRVLVTRPEPGASRTAARLAQSGHVPVLLPLTEVRPLPVVLPSEAANASAVVLTSANALCHADEALVAALKDKPCFAVGERTAGLAQARRLTDVTAGPGDAEGLADLILRRTAPAARLAYLCGRVRRATLEHVLREAGYHCVAVETYDTRDLDYTAQALATLLGREPIDAILLYSRHAAERLALLWSSGGMAEHAQSATLICISSRTAEATDGIQGARAIVAAAPHEDAMFAILRDAAKRAAP